MLKHLFSYPGVLARHRQAPALAERERFLQHCAENGMARATLISVANELRVIASKLEIAGDKPITRADRDGR